MTKNEKISEALKIRYAIHGHPSKGTKGRSHSEEHKKYLRQKSLEMWDKRGGRNTEKQKAAKNKANVYAYRARKYNAIVESSDLKLIRQIYENCPDGYHVDHIVALAAGGLHHQNNLQYLPISENCKKGCKNIYDKTLALSWKSFINPV
jgi:thymidylate synthase